MPDPLLTVVVPFYNVETYLGECLQSLRTQTLLDFECIVVDDGSPDNSHLIAEDFARRDSRFRLVRSSNQGLGPARNLGAAHASGTYLTFVDSDDIVPPRAFSLMTGILEASGSAFAAGNARRFDGPDGVTQSWTHAEAFSETRLGTHINAFPLLVRDRMAWNKVYRHSFWRDLGLEFPAGRYEDYPVSMQAHLSATAVDVVEEHIYYWRERGTGDSITQSLFDYDNLSDRVGSAEATLDIVEATGSPSVVRSAHEYFIDIDLVVLARALVQAHPGQADDVRALGQRLARRLRPQRRHADPLGDIIHDAFLRGDLDMVRAMARWRDGEGLAGLRAELPRIPRPGQARPLLRRAAPRRSFQSPRGPRRLRSALRSMTSVDAETMSLVIDVRLRPQLARRASADVVLTTDSAEFPLSAAARPTSTGLQLTLRLAASDLEGIEELWEDAELVIRLRLGGLTWSGGVDANPGLVAGPMLAPNCAYQWAAPRGHDLQVRRLDRVHVATVTAEGDEFVVQHPMLLQPRILVNRPYPTPALTLTTGGTHSRIGADILLDDPPDEPVTGVVEREVVVEHFAGDARLLLLGDSATILNGDRRVEMARDASGQLVVRHSPAAMDLRDSAAATAQIEDHDASGGRVPAEFGGGGDVAKEAIRPAGS